MSYTAASVANAFLSRAFRDKKKISPMKIQKLAYIAHGYSLVECEEPMLDEVFEAWKFGPVLSSLYHECKGYGGGQIKDYVRDIDPETGKSTPAPVPDDPAVSDIIDYVWENYGDDSAVSLSDWTHVKGGPWDLVTKGGTQILRHQDVDNALIKEYFEKNMYDA
jgi:uncharacterized phage-associated protein